MFRGAQIFRTVAVCLALVIVSDALPVSTQRSAAQFPPPLERYFASSLKLTDAERSALLANAPISRLIEGEASKEVSVFGAVWIDAPAATYVARVRDIENLERGGPFRVTKRISEPPRLSDFDRLTLPDEDVADLKYCRVGDCELKLSQEALDRMRSSLDWSKPNVKQTAEALARQLAFEYVTGYQEGGNERLAVYRDRQHPTFVANEFRSMVDRVPALFEFLPELKGYLLEYPKATLANGTSLFYWQEAQFGLKPTIRINHLIIQERPEAVAIANKLLYASHYFWTALELRVLVPDPARGRGFWFVSVNRSRSDGLSGFVGRMIRGKVQNEAQKGMESALFSTRAAIEGRR